MLRVPFRANRGMCKRCLILARLLVAQWMQVLMTRSSSSIHVAPRSEQL